MVYNNYSSTFEELLREDQSLNIHHRVTVTNLYRDRTKHGFADKIYQQGILIILVRHVVLE